MFYKKFCEYKCFFDKYIFYEYKFSQEYQIVYNILPILIKITSPKAPKHCAYVKNTVETMFLLDLVPHNPQYILSISWKTGLNQIYSKSNKKIKINYSMKVLNQKNRLCCEFLVPQA